MLAAMQEQALLRQKMEQGQEQEQEQGQGQGVPYGLFVIVVAFILYACISE